MKRQRALTVFILLVSLLIVQLAVARAEIVAGKHYVVLPKPHATEDSNKIEVLEFFWYGCPHCYSLHPLLKAWLANAPSDVNFRYVPANLRPNWATGAKAFYALEVLGKTEVLHDLIYDAIHRDKVNLHQEEILFEWIGKQGIDRAKFEQAYRSFSVQNQVARDAQLARQYQLNGVPALIIDGKYLTSGGMSGTPQGTIDVLNVLIDKARSEK
ncbi:MAG: thiol:disulfide interchange protein DsbA/DsbL [Nitrosomonas sp.]|nr:MAG: thiol:disulfide interchange protein DsbA/DsbL [Nitrosomonas sp.]